MHTFSAVVGGHCHLQGGSHSLVIQAATLLNAYDDDGGDAQTKEMELDCNIVPTACRVGPPLQIELYTLLQTEHWDLIWNSLCIP